MFFNSRPRQGSSGAGFSPRQLEDRFPSLGRPRVFVESGMAVDPAVAARNLVHAIERGGDFVYPHGMFARIMEIMNRLLPRRLLSCGWGKIPLRRVTSHSETSCLSRAGLVSGSPQGLLGFLDALVIRPGDFVRPEGRLAPELRRVRDTGAAGPDRGRGSGFSLRPAKPRHTRSHGRQRGRFRGCLRRQGPE